MTFIYIYGLAKMSDDLACRWVPCSPIAWD